MVVLDCSGMTCELKKALAHTTLAMVSKYVHYQTDDPTPIGALSRPSDAPKGMRVPSFRRPATRGC
jgi:hypothetical protein